MKEAKWKSHDLLPGDLVKATWQGGMFSLHKELITWSTWIPSQELDRICTCQLGCLITTRIVVHPQTRESFRNSLVLDCMTGRFGWVLTSYLKRTYRPSRQS